jgi:hypothetical protein
VTGLTTTIDGLAYPVVASKGVDMAIADYEEKWDEDRIVEIENGLLQGILGCRST